MKLLIICHPEEGYATEVCLYIKAEAERMNRRVVLLNAADLSKKPSGFDAIIVATSNIQSPNSVVMKYVDKYVHLLNDAPLFYISVNYFDGSGLLSRKKEGSSAADQLNGMLLQPQQVIDVPVALEYSNGTYCTTTNWDVLKLSLQKFLIKNDVMMAH